MSTPPVLLDVSRLVWRAWRGQLPTGIDRACLAYVAHYRDRACAVLQWGGHTHVMDQDGSLRLFALLLRPPAHMRSELAKLLSASLLCRGKGRTWEEGALYLNVGHTGLDRAGHRRWVKRWRLRALYYVHDLIPITHPGFARAGVPEQHGQRMRTVLDCAQGVIVNSHDSAANLGVFARGEGRVVPPLLVAPLGIADLPPVKHGTPPLDAPYFVTLGTIEGRKNHRLLLDVWRDIVQKMGEAAPMLVIIGQRGWAADDVFAALDGDRALAGHVVELSSCDDAMLAQYLAHARALLFPSFVEGQGLPLAEALALATPVIASNLDVFREMAGNIPDYEDPHDVAGWDAAILGHAAPDSAPRAAQLARMKGFTPPLWEAHFAAVERWIETLD